MRSLTRVMTASLLALAVLAPVACTRRPDLPSSEPPSAEMVTVPISEPDTAALVDTASAPAAPPSTPRPQPEPAPADDDRSSELEERAGAVALDAARKSGGERLGALAVGRTRIARDGAGTWWASVLITCSKPGIDPLPVFLKRDGARWEVFDIGTGVEPALDERFPAEVRQKL